MRIEFYRKMQSWLVPCVLVLLTLLPAEGLVRLWVQTTHPVLGRSVNFERKLVLAQRPSQSQSTILFLGDSITHYGVYADLLQSQLADQGLKVEVRNLASLSAEPSDNLFLLKTAVARGITPQVVVFNVYPKMFNRTYLDQLGAYEEFQFGNSFYGRCQSALPTGWVAVRCSLEEASLLIRYRDVLKSQWSGVLARLSTPNPPDKLQPRPMVESEVSPQGWSPLYTTFAKTDVETIPAFESTTSHGQLPDPLTRYRFTDRAILPMVQYCRRQHIALILVWYPNSRKRDAQYKAIGFSRPVLSQRLHTWAKDQGVQFWDLDWILPETHYADAVHLNAVGAIELTTQLMPRIEAVLKAPAKPARLHEAVPIR